MEFAEQFVSTVSKYDYDLGMKSVSYTIHSRIERKWKQ